MPGKKKFQVEKNAEYYAEADSVTANNFVTKKQLEGSAEPTRINIEQEKVIIVKKDEEKAPEIKETKITRNRRPWSEEQKKAAAERLKKAQADKKAFVTKMKEIDPTYKYAKGHLKELDVEQYKKDLEEKQKAIQAKKQADYDAVMERIKKGELVKIRIAKQHKRAKPTDNICYDSTSSEDENQLAPESDSEGEYLDDELEKIQNKHDSDNELTVLETEDQDSEVDVATKRVTTRSNKKALKEIKEVKQEIKQVKEKVATISKPKAVEPSKKEVIMSIAELAMKAFNAPKSKKK